MGKTKEQILTEQLKEKELNSFETSKEIEKLHALRDMLLTNLPDESNKFGEEQKWVSAFDEIEQGIIRKKILGIIKEL